MVADELRIPAETRVVRTLLVVDVVESVRLMEENEDAAVRRWRSLVTQVQVHLLPAYGGRLVKSLGDGMLLEFPRVPPAIKCAFAIQRACAAANATQPPEQGISLRMGAHVSEVIADALDLYGRGVNLASRLTSVAGPGELVVSADVRDQLTPLLDAEIEDLGECFLKHLSAPVRAYRVGPPGPRPVIEPGRTLSPQLQPVVAVVPFRARTVTPEHHVIGEILADDVISALSRTPELHVISRLSTTVFRDREATLAELQAYLKANYVLSGTYRVNGRSLVLVIELAEVASGRVVWSDSLRGSPSDVLRGENDLVQQIVSRASMSILAREIERSQAHAMPTLESYTLLLGAIGLMHRLSPRDFERSRVMLELLIERMPRQPLPYAWLAKWRVLRVQQGWAPNPEAEKQLALECTRRALDADSHCALALAIDGCVHTNLLKNLDVAQQRYERALEINPNESMAWLLKGTLHAFRGEGELAMGGTERALRLSPLDPLRYFYDSLAAAAAISAGQYARAVELARRSLKANRTHTSTLRALAIAQVQLGLVDDARETAAELMRLEPGLTIEKYLARSPSSDFTTGRLWSESLREAGVPVQ